MSQTIFSKIIAGEIPCHKVYEDDHVIAFLDIHPQVEGHTLVVPKVEVDHVWDLDGDRYDHLMAITKTLGSHMKAVIGAPRIGMVVEGFGVPHAHVHLIPLYQAEDIKKRQDLSSEPDHERLAELAKKLEYDGN